MKFTSSLHSKLLFLCHFLGCNQSLSGTYGILLSPNYPQKYPDGQYCSWSITVAPAHKIHLTFTNFSLQSENDTDALYVYDGENIAGVVLGVFFGAHTPPKDGVYSSSNHMFVIFKSDNKSSYTGFRASYSAVNGLGEYCLSPIWTRQDLPSPEKQGI